MNLSVEQNKAASALDGVNMVIAVPGAGKTTILLKRIDNLIKNGVSPEKILTITFSKIAASELKERFEKIYGYTNAKPDFYTIHAFSFKVLRDFGRKKGIDYKLLEGSKNIGKYTLLSNIYKDIHDEYISDEKLEILANEIGYVKNMMLDVDEYKSSNIDEFQKIYERYENYKKTYKYIDFDDMLTLCFEILKKDGALRNKYIKMYDYIQVDEGQDTSKIQMEIIKLLTKKKKNLFLVADDDQSIYSFRGANPEGLFELQEFFPDIKIYHMETNYRSSKNIVAISDNFISKNNVRFKKNLNAYKDLKVPVEIIKVDDCEAEFKYIKEDLKDKNINDCAILYRNNISAFGLIEYFEREDIPFNIKDNSKIKFYSHRISKDIRDIILFSEDTSEISRFEKIYYKMNGYISKNMIAFLKTKKFSGDVFDVLLEMEGLKPFSIKKLRELQENIYILKNLPMDKKVEFIGENLGYIDYLKRNSKRLSSGTANELYVFELIKKISTFSRDFQSFEGRLKYLDAVKKREMENSGCIFSTVHSAKGKEFETVYMIDLYDGNFPSEVEAKEEILKEEERRLFYVGMTRAKENLKLICPSKVGDEDVKISRFVEEIENMKLS